MFPKEVFCFVVKGFLSISQTTIPPKGTDSLSAQTKE